MSEQGSPCGGSRASKLLLRAAVLHPGTVAGPASGARRLNPKTLRPGLVATYRDTAKPTPAEIPHLEPTIALAWKASEAAAPAPGGRGWHGPLAGLSQRLPRQGLIASRCRLRGKFRLTVAGKELF